ncbi:hypothetical protein FQN60_008482 [Etheostoma spectabile]|uniref:BZIP domain-containing protein n=1 Tax=Etheostoma spectabile TaxID=54343 RepID=A0A5J5CSG3_9PERO|nr:hypothetical protein FQN60_008482 [Etheostoma spectabile]
MSSGDMPSTPISAATTQARWTYPVGQMAYGSASGHGGGGALNTTPRHGRPSDVPEVPQPLGDPTSPPSLSPIDLETQERIKAERKKLRKPYRRVKCEAEAERISRLEEKVKVLKNQNSDLATAAMLREPVAQLKQKV